MKTGMKLAGMIVLAATAFSEAYAADAHQPSQTITFKMNVMQGSCTVTSDPTVNLGDNLNGEDLLDNDWAVIGKKNFNVSLIDCTGTGAGKTPVIKVSPKEDGAAVANTDDKLFPNTATVDASKGFGVVIFKSGESGENGIIEESNLFKVNDVVWTGPEGTDATNQSIELTAAVACGPRDNCKISKLKAGKLQSNVIFTFHYQ
jgi:type 1 fimbria pilin